MKINFPQRTNSQGENMKGKYHKQERGLLAGRFQVQEENNIKLIEQLARKYGLANMTITQENLPDGNFSSYSFLTFHYNKDPNVSDIYVTSPTPGILKYIKKNGGKIETKKPEVRKEKKSKNQPIQDPTSLLDKIF